MPCTPVAPEAGAAARSCGAGRLALALLAGFSTIPSALLSWIELAEMVLKSPSSTSTPAPALNAMVLPAPAAAPPIRLLLAPASIRIPSTLLPMTAVPNRSVPMKLPCTSLFRAPDPEICTPLLLPAITLPAPVAVPPMTFNEAPVMSTPSTALPRSVTPSLAVPMKLPSTRLPVASAPLITTPLLLLEMTLRAAVVVPPMRLFGALSRCTPSKLLPNAEPPSGFSPMMLPWIALPDAPGPFSQTP